MKGACLVGDTRNLLGDSTSISYLTNRSGFDSEIESNWILVGIFILVLSLLNVLTYRLSKVELSPEDEKFRFWAKCLLVLAGIWVLFVLYFFIKSHPKF